MIKLIQVNFMQRDNKMTQIRIVSLSKLQNPVAMTTLYAHKIQSGITSIDTHKPQTLGCHKIIRWSNTVYSHRMARLGVTHPERTLIFY